MSVGLKMTAAAFIVAGVLHFVIPKFYLAIMPTWLPAPLLLVQLSGVAELLGGIGLLVPSTRRAAAVGLIVLLIAVLPANVEMLRQAYARPSALLFRVALWLRLPLQPLLMWWVWRVAQSGRDLVR
jgi:uncharacterized membrane protein